MDPKVVEALHILGFEDVTKIPKIKEIIQRYRKLALTKHPDKNDGSQEAKADFQNLLNAYKIAGEAAQNIPADPEDRADHIARKLFQQFQVKSVKENSSSVTILTEKHLYSIWMDTLTTFAGAPEDKGVNGSKFTYYDTFNDSKVKVFLTMYHTGKLLIQAERNKHIINIHFLNTHLEHLFNEVYRKTMYKNYSTTKSLHSSESKTRSPITKPTKKAGRITVTISKCQDCNFQTAEPNKMKKHMKEHTTKPRDPSSSPPKAISSPLAPMSSPSTTPEQRTNTVSEKPPRFDIPAPLNVLPSTPTNTSDSMRCYICPDSYYKEGHWEEHSNAVHNKVCKFCDERFLFDTNLKEHTEQFHTSETLKTVNCEQCKFTCKTNRHLKTHIKNSHPSSNSDIPVKCDICDFITSDMNELQNHITKQHIRSSTVNIEQTKTFKCDICKFTSTNRTKLIDHIAQDHPPIPAPSFSFQCELCPFHTNIQNDLENHIQSTHASLRCKLCPFSSASYFTMGLHMGQNHQHPDKDKVLSCEFCDKAFNNPNYLQDHISNHHPNSSNQLNYQQPQYQTLASCNHPKDYSCDNCADCPTSDESPEDHIPIVHESSLRIEDPQPSKDSLNILLEQQNDILKNLINFKDYVTTQLSAMATFQESLRIDIQSQLYASTKLTTSFAQFESQQAHILHSLQTMSSNPHSMSTNVTPIISVPNTTPEPPRTTPLPPPASPPTQRPPPSSLHSTAPSRLPTSKREKVLFITDSIGSNADRRHLEEATNTLIYTENAYDAQFKADAWRPDLNFCDVVKRVASKRDYKYAVLQGASSDVSNLDTSDPSPPNIAWFEQEVFISSQNMITAAESLLKTNHKIENVVILERTPRFDPLHLDPGQIKPQLSQYANQVLRDQLQSSPFKDQIIVAAHCLPSEFHANIYGNPSSRRFDGVHLNGPDGSNFYTRSLCNILQNILSKHSRSSHNHTIPTKTREPSATKPPHLSPPSQSLSPPPKAPEQSSRSKPDMVMIEIESPDQYYPFSYSVPTTNFYSTLGN